MQRKSQASVDCGHVKNMFINDNYILLFLDIVMSARQISNAPGLRLQNPGFQRRPSPLENSIHIDGRDTGN